MHQVLRTEYGEGADWQAVRLPYFGASMLVVVPHEGKFADVESQLDRSFLGRLESSYLDATVGLRLPKWESSTAVQLKEPLMRMGIGDLFEPYIADLSGIEPARELYVTVVAHQANVAVDEEGTEAAAAVVARQGERPRA